MSVSEVAYASSVWTASVSNVSALAYLDKRVHGHAMTGRMPIPLHAKTGWKPVPLGLLHSSQRSCVLQRVDISDRLIPANALYSRETQCESAVMAVAFIDGIERNF